MSHKRSILPLLHIRWVILATLCVSELEGTVIKPTAQVPTRFSKTIYKNHFAGPVSNKGKEPINVEVPCITQQILKLTPAQLVIKMFLKNENHALYIVWTHYCIM